MIVAAGALVLLGLGLFVAGIVTDTTTFYWLCVGACAAAGALLLIRLLIGRTASSTSVPSTSVPSTTVPVAGQPPAREATASPAPDGEPGPAPALHPPRAVAGQPVAGDPPVEDVEVTDLLLVVDLRDEVLVVDEHPRYHLGGCSWLAGRSTLPLPVDEARTDGFTPCALCAPDRNLAERERGRRA